MLQLEHAQSARRSAGRPHPPLPAPPWAQSDRSGAVSVEKLRRTVMDFELTINIDAMLQEMDKVGCIAGGACCSMRNVGDKRSSAGRSRCNQPGMLSVAQQCPAQCSSISSSLCLAHLQDANGSVDYNEFKLLLSSAI